MQFKQLEIKPEGSWIKRTLTFYHFRKSVIAIIIGAVIGFGFYYFSEGKLMESMSGKDIINRMLVGGFF